MGIKIKQNNSSMDRITKKQIIADALGVLAKFRDVTSVKSQTGKGWALLTAQGKGTRRAKIHLDFGYEEKIHVCLNGEYLSTVSLIYKPFCMARTFSKILQMQLAK